MLIKEKIIFLALLVILIGSLAFGFYSQGNKKEATKEFLQEMEALTEKAKIKKRLSKDAWDLEKVKVKELQEDYEALIKRSIFFREAQEAKVKNVEVAIPLKEEEPKKPVFIYKGKMMVGTKVMVIIEDQGTGKSFSVQEGDMVGDFSVLSIDEKEVRLKKSDGEEIALSTIKKEKEEKKDESKEKKPEK